MNFEIVISGIKKNKNKPCINDEIQIVKIIICQKIQAFFFKKGSFSFWATTVSHSTTIDHQPIISGQSFFGGSAIIMQLYVSHNITV